MTPEHIKGWISKPPAGAQSLRLMVEASTTRIEPVGTWDAAELEDRDNGEIARLIVASAAEYTEAEGTPQKFFIQWLGKGDRVLKSVTHRTSPPEKGDEHAPMSTAELMRAVLQSNLDKDKSMINALDASSKASDRTIKMLTDRLEDSQKRIAKLQRDSWDDEDRAGMLPALPAEATDEQREEHKQRARAWSTLSDQMPSLVDMAITAFLRSTGGGGADAGTNGKSKKKATAAPAGAQDATPKETPAS